MINTIVSVFIYVLALNGICYKTDGIYEMLCWHASGASKAAELAGVFSQDYLD